MRPLLFLSTLCLAGCTGAAANNQAVTGGPPSAATLPADAAILGPQAIPAMLRQCSRATPEPGDGAWQPTVGDIAALEAALPAALTGEGRADAQDFARAPEGWRRQYVGVVRGGRRFIYGNFTPRDPQADRYATDPDAWRRTPIIVCDGGPAFFGAEYDVAARRFTHLAFNGMA